jgi:hypothetical protein
MTVDNQPLNRTTGNETEPSLWQLQRHLAHTGSQYPRKTSGNMMHWWLRAWRRRACVGPEDEYEMPTSGIQHITHNEIRLEGLCSYWKVISVRLAKRVAKITSVWRDLTSVWILGFLCILLKWSRCRLGCPQVAGVLIWRLEWIVGIMWRAVGCFLRRHSEIIEVVFSLEVTKPHLDRGEES